MVVSCSTRSSGCCELGLRGETYRSASAHGRPPGTSSTSGRRTRRSTAYFGDCGASPSRTTRTPPSCGASTGHRFELRAAAAAGAKRSDPQEPADHALGRSGGGWGTKIHILCDVEGHPLHFELSAGQAHDGPMLAPVLQGADEALHDDRGVVMEWPLALAGDKGYRAEWIDRYLLALGITPVIPTKHNETRALRPVAFNKRLYRRRSIVECLIGWLKESRRVVTRFEKTAINFGGMVRLAFIHRYLRIFGA
ncbi:MAG: IS5 family transposase [Deltaproteobacteria bacterium]|nr:IS5 family transposase [Deltaproteobacteria bacterium]